NPRVSGTGDLVLVRAVPTGALRRTLRLSLVDVEAPDRLWAIVRGVEPGAPLGDGERPLGQRLDAGERVLWSANPMASPWGGRRVLNALLAAGLALASAWMLVRAVSSLKHVARAHALGPATTRCSRCSARSTTPRRSARFCVVIRAPKRRRP